MSRNCFLVRCLGLALVASSFAVAGGPAEAHSREVQSPNGSSDRVENTDAGGRDAQDTKRPEAAQRDNATPSVSYLSGKPYTPVTLNLKKRRETSYLDATNGNVLYEPGTPLALRAGSSEKSSGRFENLLVGEDGSVGYGVDTKFNPLDLKQTSELLELWGEAGSLAGEAEDLKKSLETHKAALLKEAEEKKEIEKKAAEEKKADEKTKEVFANPIKEFKANPMEAVAAIISTAQSRFSNGVIKPIENLAEQQTQKGATKNSGEFQKAISGAGKNVFPVSKGTISINNVDLPPEVRGALSNPEKGEIKYFVNQGRHFFQQSADGTQRYLASVGLDKGAAIPKGTVDWAPDATVLSTQSPNKEQSVSWTEATKLTRVEVGAARKALSNAKSDIATAFEKLEAARQKKAITFFNSRDSEHGIDPNEIRSGQSKLSDQNIKYIEKQLDAAKAQYELSKNGTPINGYAELENLVKAYRSEEKAKHLLDAATFARDLEKIEMGEKPIGEDVKRFADDFTAPGTNKKHVLNSLIFGGVSADDVGGTANIKSSHPKIAELRNSSPEHAAAYMKAQFAQSQRKVDLVVNELTQRGHQEIANGIKEIVSSKDYAELKKTAIEKSAKEQSPYCVGCDATLNVGLDSQVEKIGAKLFDKPPSAARLASTRSEDSGPSGRTSGQPSSTPEITRPGGVITDTTSAGPSVPKPGRITVWVKPLLEIQRTGRGCSNCDEARRKYKGNPNVVFVETYSPPGGIWGVETQE